jgi:hypothetical protein
VPVWEGNSRGHSLILIDPASGQMLPDYEPISLGQALFHAFPPDGRTLAVVGFVSSEYPSGGSLHLIDLNTWEEQVQELRLDSYVNAMAFSPGGEQLAIAYGNAKSRVLVLDVNKPLPKSKTAVQEVPMDFLVYKMRFNTAGDSLMVYGSKIENRSTASEMSSEPPVAALLDNIDLSMRWSAELEGLRHGVVPKEEKTLSRQTCTNPARPSSFSQGWLSPPTATSFTSSTRTITN